MNGDQFINGVYYRKIEILEQHGYPVINIDGYDYVEDDGILVSLEDIPSVYEFLGGVMSDLFRSVELSREPTKAEIKRGYGARHWKAFPIGMLIKETFLVGHQVRYSLKSRIKCPIDKLIYTR